MPRSRVVRGGDAAATPAELGIVSSSAARDLVVDPQLVDAAVREGYDEGYQAGYEHARGVALDEARSALDELHTRLTAVVSRLSQAADDVLARETTARHQIEHDIVTAAVAIAEELVGHELRHADERARDAIARALALAPDDGLVVARLNPDDAAAIGDPNDLAPGRALQIVADAALAPGDAVVDVGACRIDARIDDALQRVREVLG
jgi:flagellar assembly protein FliH